MPVLPLADNYRIALKDAFGAEYLDNLSFLPVEPAGHLLHIRSTEVINEGTLNRKSTFTNDG